MSQNIVSVVLPIWKPKITDLKKSIDSVLSQSYKSLELIIVYRNHPDTNESFYKLIEEYNDKRIRVIESKKKGVASGMNEGIIHSFGSYIARIDGDDLWDSNKLELQIKYKEDNKLNIVGTWGFFISNEGIQVSKIEHPVTNSEIRKKLMLNDPIIHSTLLIDKKIFDEVGFYDESFKTAEDYELWFRLISSGYKFGNLSKYLVKVRINPNSISRSNWQSHRVDTIRAKNRAIRKYGFTTARDLLYYLPTPFYYFISPKNAQRIRQILGIFK